MSSSNHKTEDLNPEASDNKTSENQFLTHATNSLDDLQSQQGKENLEQGPDKSKDTENSEKSQGEGEGKEEEADEEEEGECGFCLFMKGGGCKDSFVAWEKCIEEAEKNNEEIVEKCFQATAALKKCMEAHADYYEPILRAEKAAEEEAAKELEREKAMDGSEGNTSSKESEQKIESSDLKMAGSINQ